MAAETTIFDYPGKVNDLEIALWASKNVQNITGSTIKTFQIKNQHKLSCKSEFPFVVVVAVAHHLNISYMEYVLPVFPSSFIKISKKLWKWFEFIHYSFLVKETCFNYAVIYTCSCHKKWVCAAYTHIIYLCGMAGI